MPIPISASQTLLLVLPVANVNSVLSYFRCLRLHRSYLLCYCGLSSVQEANGRSRVPYPKRTIPADFVRFAEPPQLSSFSPSNAGDFLVFVVFLTLGRSWLAVCLDQRRLQSVQAPWWACFAQFWLKPWLNYAALLFYFFWPLLLSAPHSPSRFTLSSVLLFFLLVVGSVRYTVSLALSFLKKTTRMKQSRRTKRAGQTTAKKKELG